jgi:hypothetical protein
LRASREEDAERNFIKRDAPGMTATRNADKISVGKSEET